MGNMTEDNDNKLLYLSCEQCELGYLPVEMIELDDDKMVYRCICGYENMLYYFRR